MKFAIFMILCVSALPLSAHCEGDDPLFGSRFQSTPFAGVCEGVAMLGNKDYLEHKAYWDNVIPHCGVDVQILPDTGFFATMTSRLGQAADQDQAVSFLQNVGKRTLENIDFNNKVTELWIHCANNDTTWIEKKRADAKGDLGSFDKDFYDPAQCGSRLQQLKDLVKNEGKTYRVNRELMKYTAGAGTSALALLRKGADLATAGKMDLELPGEKVALSDDEKAEVKKASKQIDDKALEQLEQEKQSLLAKVKKGQEGKSAFDIQMGAGLGHDIPDWFHQWYIETDHGKNPSARAARPYDQQQLLSRRTQQFPEFFKKYSDTLSDARILAFLGTASPDNAALAKAAQKLLDNGMQTRKDTEKLIAIGDGPKAAKKKINQMASLMQNGPVLRDLLREDPRNCHSAVGLANFVANKSTRDGAAVGVGLFTAGIGVAVVGPAVLAGAGISASAAALSTTFGTVSSAAMLAVDGKKYFKAKHRTFNVVQSHDKVFGAGRSVADVSEYNDAADALVLDAAMAIATTAVPLAYQEFFADNGVKLQGEAMVKRLMQDPKAGGMGLDEAGARKLLAEAASTDKDVAKKAVAKLAGGLHLDQSQLSGTSEIVKHELENPDPAGGTGLTPKTFLERATERFHSTAVKVDPESYKQLRDTAIASYFPDTAQVEVQPMYKQTGAKLTDAAVKKFQRDFDALLDQRSASFGLQGADFRKWLIAKNGVPYPKLDAVTVENVFKKQGATLEDLQSALYLSYGTEMKEKGYDVMKLLHVSEMGRLSLLLGKKTVGFFAGALTTAVSVGPVTNIVNSLVSAPMQPITESAGQLSNVMFANVTTAISKSLSKNMKKITTSMAALSSTTATLDETKFDGLDRDQAKKLMDGFDTRYSEIFMRMNAYMPPYKRSGRDVMRDWMIMQPMQLASQASTFNTEFTMNQALLVAIQDRTKDHAPSEQEKQLMQQYKDNMEEAENRLAAALATWRIYTFTYAEASRDPAQADTNAKMFNTLQHYEKFMNMDKYREDLSGKIKEAFGAFDPSFKELPTLEHHRVE
jgi:hypothetical protein